MPADSVAVLRAMLPCPFCGEVPTIANIRADENQGTKWGGVVCSCGIVGPEVRTGYGPVAEWADCAAEEWNRRAPPAALSAQGAVKVEQIERLERVVAALPLPLVANNATELWHGLGPGGRIAACDWEGLPDTLAEAINALPALLQLARAVQTAATGEVIEVGDDEEGQPRVLIHSTRDELRKGPPLPFRTVALVPVPTTEGK